MSVKITVSGEVVTAYLDGEIDHHTARNIRAQIDAAIGMCEPKRLILDMGNITFMDSSGVGLIMGRYRLMQSHGGEVAVENVSPRIERMLRLSGIGQLARISGKEQTE